MTDQNSNRDHREQQLDAIIAGYYRELEQGSCSDPVKWLSAHPEFETELRSFFADIALMPKPEKIYQPDPASASTLNCLFDGASQAEDKFPVFANYEVLEEIDRGGMGIVYKARQLRPDRLVAIKMMRKGRFASRDDVERFLNEANAASQLDAEAVVPVYEVGDLAGEPFIVMKFVNGKSLQQLLNENAISFTDALAKLRQIALAIGLAHDSGIIHRDLKPANILIEHQSGRPWVTDFGLAKFLDADQSLTAAGDVMGTPGYMSPEQASGDKRAMSPATDVYALGAILYRLLTGRTPIVSDSGNLARTLQLIQEHDVISPRSISRTICPELNILCMKCLETDPGRRYQNARLLAEDLGRFLEGEPILARSPGVFRKLQRWARHRPGLAATWLVLTFFGTYHVTNALLGGLLDYPSFNRAVKLVLPLAAFNAWFWQRCLIRKSGAAWPLYAWATGEVFLLTVLLLFTDGARSGLVSLYYVIVAVSVLRCRPLLVGYVTLLAMAGYVASWGFSRFVAAGVQGPLQGVPVLLSLGLIGFVQYLALKRSSASYESRRPDTL